MPVQIRGTNDLQRHTESLRQSLEAAASRVIGSAWFILGREGAAFETAYASYCGVPHCISLANGTDALEISLRALKIGSGSRVATVANAGMYSTAAILAVGATPHFVDIDLETLLIDLNELEELLQNNRAHALIVTHLYGRMPDMSQVSELCSRFNVPLIEDCAQAHGASWKGRKAGSFGDIGTFSFYPTKNLGALGDGGAATTSSEILAERLRALRQYGWTKKYVASVPHGRNSRLDELQAAFLSAKLPHLDGWNVRRREIASLYSMTIVSPRVRVSSIGAGDVAHLYVVLTKDRDGLRRHLSNAEIPTDVHYPLPDYQQPALRDLFSGIKLTKTEEACAEVLTLPCFPEMTDDEVLFIAERVNEWL